VTDEIASQRTTVVAFCSPADGIGQSCMTANIAVMLASQGLRVLIVDLDLASPSLHRYLSDFLPSRLTASESKSPVRLSCEFQNPRGSVDFIGPLSDTVTDSARYTVGRSDLAERGYDVTLIDMPNSAGAAALARHLADILVLGYSLTQPHMKRAMQLADTLQSSGETASIRILPVPMRVDQNAGQTIAVRRVAGYRQFAHLLADLSEDEKNDYWQEIEIPYEPEYAVEEGLPFLDPESPQRERLVEAYRRLTWRLVPGAKSAPLLTLTSRSLSSYADSRRMAAARDSTVTILHAAADRYWAEWLAAELQAMGLTSIRQRIDQIDPGDSWGASKLLVVSARLLAVHDIDSLLAALSQASGDGAQQSVAVTIDGRWLPGYLFPTLARIKLYGKSAKEAHAELAAYYQVTGSSVPARNQIHFPASREGITIQLPSHSGVVYGRDDVIDQIRDHFTASTAPVPLSLTGLPGVGKSLIALEYARRFGGDYDLVLFIRADSDEAIRAGLAEVAAHVPPRHPGGDPALAAFEELQSTLAQAKRWLLIYDGADDPSLIDRFLPSRGPGHVLLTTRGAAPGPAVPLAVRSLSRADAQAMVSSLVPGIRLGDAVSVADAMKEVPLALHLACAWLRVTMAQRAGGGALLASISDDTTQIFKRLFAEAAQISSDDGPDPVNFVVGLHLDGLEQHDELSGAAVLLLETCAFLGTSGMSWRLLGSPAMLAQLAARAQELTDPILLPSVVHTLASRGLFLGEERALPGDLARGPLSVHSKVLEVVRDRMPLAVRQTRQTQVCKMLAACVPPSIDDDFTHDSIYAELLQHVGPSGAITQTDFEVRQWLVQQVRFMWQSDSLSSWHAAAELGSQLEQHWLAVLPDAANDPLVLRLRTQLANVHRSLGNFSRAREIDADVLNRQRATLGLRHPRTLMTARSYGADLRLVGDFDNALLEDSATWQALTGMMGREHLLAITASGNLALSELLAGDLEEALQRRLEQDLPHCERFEYAQPWEAAWVLGHIGALQRELGRYHESRESFQQARDGFMRGHTGGTVAPISLPVLRAEAGVAIAERHLGSPNPNTTSRVLDECRRLFGDSHPMVPAMILSYAGDLHALGKSQEAVETATDALARHTALFGTSHPFTYVNQVDLSIYALAARQPLLADEMSKSALAGLEPGLSGRHPWVLAASVARANVFAVTNRLEDAVVLEERALSEYEQRLGADHIFTRVVRTNAAHTRRLRNEPGPSADPAAEASNRRAIELDIPPY
jgi:tetratricopeptide (TPR) repeat protein